MTETAKPPKRAASGRFDVFREPAPGAASWVHRWMGNDFQHTRGDAAPHCLCRPHYIPPGDTRSLDEIADDIEEEDAASNA